LKDHADLMGYQFVPGSTKPVQISLKDHMYTSSCIQKSAFFVGKQGGGKSSIAQALARLCAVRCNRSKILFSKSFDPLGELTRSGLVKQVGGFVFSDFCMVSLMNTRLIDEDVMAILDVAEPASFKCRYHVGVMEKRIPRFFCVNAGKGLDGSMDHGAWFELEGLLVLGYMARGQDLGEFTDKALAMARRVVIFPITTDDDIALDVKAETTKKEDEFEQLLEAERLYREQLEE
jgi:energy-coupling factor transporter ATP-binding protein EcfA2